MLEANGALSDEARDLLKTVTQRTAFVKGSGRFLNPTQRAAYLLTELTTELSVALQKAAADKIWNCCSHVMRCNLRDTSRRGPLELTC